jgi:RHS repeat-associated protein
MIPSSARFAARRTVLAMFTVATIATNAFAIGGPSPGAVTAETVKLPSGPGSVRGLADNANVDAFSGQVQYTVPIELPQSSGGFTPSLSLAYSGELGNGPLGIGWFISQPAIRRSLRLGVPAYDTTDELQLVGMADGAQLVPLAGGGYRVEGQGHSYVGSAVAGGFELQDANGLVYRFGTTVASRKANGTQVAQWYVDEVRNVNGQSIAYRYHTHLGEVYLDAIEWGPTVAGARAFRAELVYGTRADAVVSYRTGFRVASTMRVERIRIWSFGALQRQVRLTYDDTFALSRLARVRVTSGDEVDALPALAFSYAAANAASTTAVPDLAGWGLNLQGTSLFDVDGDGAVDLLRLTAAGHSYRRNLGGTFAAAAPIAGASGATLANVRLVDLSGDSTAELVRQQGSQWTTYRLDGTGWTSLGGWPGATNVSLSTVAVADLDGDNVMDVIGVVGSAIRVWMGTRTGLAAPVIRAAIDPARTFVQPGNSATSFQDINGDGLADVVYLASAAMYLYLGRGDGTFEKYRDVPYPWTGTVLTSQVQLGDIDRDGLMDVIVVRGGNVAWHRGRADGSVELAPVALPRPAGTDGSVVVALADANGNGSLDIVWSSDAGMWVVDLAGPTSAGMLTAISNGLGQTERFTYEASTKLAFDAALAGTPWTTSLPFAIPVAVASRVVLGSGGPDRSARLDIRDGVYDRDERRFVGFSEARSTQPDPADGGPAALASRKVQRFHAGLGIDRVLRGALMYEREESGAGTVYTETTHVRAAVPVDQLPSTDPRLRRAVLLSTETKHFEGYATPLVTRTLLAHDAEGREVETRRLGRLDLVGDESITRRVYTAGRSAQGVRDRVCDESLLTINEELVSRTQTIYGNDQSIAPLCDASTGWVRSSRGYLTSEARWVTLDETSYDAAGNPVQKAKGGIVRNLEYDVHGLHPVAEIVHPDPQHALRWEMTWNNALGVALSARDADTTETLSTHDGLGRLLTTAKAGALPHEHHRYHWAGPRPYTETFTYDGAATSVPALPSQWTPSGGWRHVVSVFDSAGAALFVATRLDTDRWLISERTQRDALGRATAMAETYEWTGILDALVTSALPTTVPVRTATYDAHGRITLQTLPSGGQTTTTYRAFESTATPSDLSPVTTTRDGLDRIASTSRTVDGVTQGVAATYDAADRITKLRLTAANQPAIEHTFAYDTLGRLFAAADPDIGARTMQYDDGGRLLAQTNGAQQTTSFTYDGAGRLASMLGSDGSLFRYHYDTALDAATFPRTAGRLAWAEEPTGQVQVGYDMFGRESRHRRTVDGRTADRNVSFSASGLPLVTDDGDGLAIAYQYDAAARLVRAGDLLQVELMDASGRPLQERFQNGVRQTYERDTLGQPSRIRIARPDGSALYDAHITRNAYGAVSTVQDQDGTGLDHGAAFTYDGGARLTQAVLGTGSAAYQFSYQYDGFQNMRRREAHGPTQLGILTGQYAYGESTNGVPRGPRQLTSITPDAGAPTTFDYDAGGRTVRQGARALAYNGFDQLVRVTDPAGVTEHAYGFDGQRVRTRAIDGSAQIWFNQQTSERADGARDHDIFMGDRLIARVTRQPLVASAAAKRPSASVAGVTRGIQLGLGFVGVLLAAATLATRRRRAWRAMLGIVVLVGSMSCSAPRTQQQAAALSTTSRILYYHAAIGAGPVLVTRADGAVHDERRYEPYGAAIDSSQTGAVDYKHDPHNSLNKLTDADTGWSYHGARWFGPETGRWLTPDPPVKGPEPTYLEQPWGLHPYQYVDQNPVLYWDPDGCNPGAIIKRPQPPWLKFGNDVHDVIQQYYKDAHAGELVITDKTIGGILTNMLGAHWLAFGPLATRPDIYNATTGDVYEIKSLWHWSLGYATAELYVDLLNRFGLSAQRGPSSDPGVSGLAVVQGNRLVTFWSPQRGVILYYEIAPPRPVWEPAYARAPSRVETAAKRTAVTAIIGYGVWKAGKAAVGFLFGGPPGAVLMLATP